MAAKVNENVPSGLLGIIFRILYSRQALLFGGIFEKKNNHLLQYLQVIRKFGPFISVSAMSLPQNVDEGGTFSGQGDILNCLVKQIMMMNLYACGRRNLKLPQASTSAMCRQLRKPWQ